MKISMDKEYTTRDGRPVRVLCVDRNSKQPVIALVAGITGDQLKHYCSDGRWLLNGSNNHNDLIEVKPKRTVEVWLNH